MYLPSHTDISSTFRLIEAELGRVKELIIEQLTSCNGSVGELLEHINAQRGKMLRSGLVLLSGSCQGKITDQHIRVAAAAEIIHTATLLHDDVIDEGQKRRGLPTINILRGNESAVLLGDFLLSKASVICADLEPRVNKTIAVTTARVCEGELRQVIQRQNWHLSESEYIDIITEKSASFFSSCCYLGGLLAEASEARVQSLACFGRNTGIAFQITDDLLDIIGDESKTGKTLGSDADKNKLTLAVIHLLNQTDEKGKEVIKSKLNAGVEGKKDVAEMLTLSGSLEYAHKCAEEFVDKAIEALADFKESDAKDALIETARFVVSRGA